jgi:hypothetical protein
VPALENLGSFYQRAIGKPKKQILSGSFSEKVHFECEKVVPPKYIPPIEFLINARGVLEEFKNKKEVVTDLFFKIAYLFNERCNYNAMMEYVTI